MDWIVWLLFESWPALAAILFTVNFILLVHWRRGGTPRPLQAGLSAAVVLLTLQALVTTRREHALRILEGIERDVRSGLTVHLRAALDEDFEADTLGPEAFLERVEQALDRVRVAMLFRGKLLIKPLDGDTFLVEVPYQADVDSRHYRGWIRTRWEITFVKRPEGWRIADIEPLHIDGWRNPSWKRLPDD